MNHLAALENGRYTSFLLTTNKPNQVLRGYFNIAI